MAINEQIFNLKKTNKSNPNLLVVPKGKWKYKTPLSVWLAGKVAKVKSWKGRSYQVRELPFHYVIIRKK